MPKRPEIPVKDFAEAMGLDPGRHHRLRPNLFGQAANNGQMVIELAPKAPVPKRCASWPQSHRPRHGRAPATRMPFRIFSFLKGKKAG